MGREAAQPFAFLCSILVKLGAGQNTRAIASKTPAGVYAGGRFVE